MSTLKSLCFVVALASLVGVGYSLSNSAAATTTREDGGCCIAQSGCCTESSRCCAGDAACCQAGVCESEGCSAD